MRGAFSQNRIGTHAARIAPPCVDWRNAFRYAPLIAPYGLRPTAYGLRSYGPTVLRSYHQVNGMPMRNPPHPGAGLKEDIEALGLSVAEAATGLGVTRQQLYRIIRSQSGISPEMALRLEKAIGGTADGWLRMQVNHDLAQARARIASAKIKRLEPKVA